MEAEPRALTAEERRRLLLYQEAEITEYHIYGRLARMLKAPENKSVLEQIAADELRHYHRWREYTGQEVQPNRLKIWWYTLVSRVLGFTFGIKLMERGEGGAQDNYTSFGAALPEAETIAREESEHEEALIAMLDEERLRYTGSIVLGLNDALVELTGALAGLTLALQNTRLIAMTGAITGIAAALSMAASEYLSTKSEETTKNPLRAALYTGFAYVGTVLVLILPYLVLTNYYVCLALTLAAAILIIGFFNYYVSVAKDMPFKSRFLEMAGLSLGVAALSFIIGFVMRAVFGIEV
ncbi:MAG: VIT1/CCC1 transporter family protein [Anaerolineae bacterium]|nr:VIT1/CCC1 transporter family protein [Anaerolineae bacterium]